MSSGSAARVPAVPRPPPAPPATRPWTARPTVTAPPPSFSGTPATTRPRPCCSASPGAREPARLAGMRPGPGDPPPPAARPRARRDRRRLRRPRPAGVDRPAQRRPGLPAHPGPSPCCRSSTAPSDPGSPPRSPAPPSSLREDADALDALAEGLFARASRGRRRPGPGRRRPGRRACSRPSPTPSAGGGAARGPQGRVPGGGAGTAARPRDDALVTRWTGAEGGRTCPGGVSSGTGVWEAGVRPSPVIRTPIRRWHEPTLTGSDVDASDMGDDLSSRSSSPRSRSRPSSPSSRRRIDADYAGKDLLLVGVLKGAVMVMADLARALHAHRRDGLDGGVVLRLGHEVLRRRADPQGPRPRHHRPARADRRGHRRLGPDPVLAAGEPARRAGRRRSRSARCCASRTPRRSRSTCSTSASTSRTSSSSATASTTPSATATCRVVGTLAPHVYAADPLARAGTPRDSGTLRCARSTPDTGPAVAA